MEVRRTDVLLRPDARRVIARLFLPGQESAASGISRASAVVARCLAMSESEVQETLAEVLTSYAPRHRGFAERLDAHFVVVAHRVDGAAALSPQRRRLIGAYFTKEFAVEAAALFNPSLVAHPEQDGAAGGLRFVMSARAVGEGHLSSIVFRTGRLSTGAAPPIVTVDPASAYVTAGAYAASPIDRERIRLEATAAGADAESLAFVLAGLPAQFTPEALDGALAALRGQRLTRVNGEHTATCLQLAATGSYEVVFPQESDLSERALMPGSAAESGGVEDARFVRFTEDDGTATYLATYTAFDGDHIVPRRLQTHDFRTFRATSFTGRAAANKGMALFPRRVDGQYLALSRWDRENNAIAVSADGHHWDEVRRLQAPEQPWELIQLGNCGPPIETPQGWLVLTHGVGAMRGYSIGAILLDLADPARVVGRLASPLLRPAGDERDGYVPNVVYSCGALVHEQTLVLPYGCSDTSIRVAVLSLPTLLDRLLEHPRPPGVGS